MRGFMNLFQRPAPPKPPAPVKKPISPTGPPPPPKLEPIKIPPPIDPKQWSS